MREAENEVVAKKAEESPVESLSSMKERLERLKQINPEEGMFQSIGTKKERRKTLEKMISGLVKETGEREETASKEKANSAKPEAKKAKGGFWRRLFGGF